MVGQLAIWFDSIAGAAATVAVVALAVLAGRVWVRRKSSLVAPRGTTEPAPSIASPSGGGTERRQQLRRPDAPLAIVLSETDTEGKPLEGWVLNRAGGGLCLSLNQSFPVGTTLQVRLATQAAMPWVPVEVKYCAPFSSRWKVGCQFLHPDSKDVLVLLYA
jgi:hypothetical protein